MVYVKLRVGVALVEKSRANEEKQRAMWGVPTPPGPINSSLSQYLILIYLENTKQKNHTVFQAYLLIHRTIFKDFT